MHDDQYYRSPNLPLPTPPKKRRWPFVLGALVLAAVILACLGSIVSGSSDAPPPKELTTPSTIEPPASSGGPKAKKTEPHPDTTSIDEGVWEVGTDVKPGKYKTKGAKDGLVVFCSWTITKGEQFVDMGSNNSTTAQGVATLKAGQTFETQGCQPWALQTPAAPVNLTWTKVSQKLSSKKVYVISQGLSGWPVSSAVNWIDGYTGSDWVNASSCPRGAYRCIWVKKDNGLRAPVIAATYGYNTSRVVIKVDVAYANSKGIKTQAKRKYVIAHELGHAGFLRAHNGSKKNLMYSRVGGYHYGLTASQKSTLRSH